MISKAESNCYSRHHHLKFVHLLRLYYPFYNLSLEQTYLFIKQFFKLKTNFKITVDIQVY